MSTKRKEELTQWIRRCEARKRIPILLKEDISVLFDISPERLEQMCLEGNGPDPWEGRDGSYAWPDVQEWVEETRARSH